MVRPISGVAGRLVVAACVAASVTAGCGGDGDEDSAFRQAGAGGLAQALARVRATDATRAYFEYGDVAALSDLTGGRAGGEYGAVLGVGYSSIAGRVRQLPDAIGFDPLDADRAFLAGRPPEQVGALTGSFDTDAVDAALADRHGERRDAGGGTLWVWSEDGDIALDSPWIEMGLVHQFNTVYSSHRTFGYASTLASLDWLLDPGGDTLGDSADHGMLARCLGEVTVAILTPIRAGGGVMTGAGVRLRDGEATELWCVRTDDADTVAARIDDALGSGTSSAGRPWSQMLTGIEVETVEGGVRVTAHPARTAGVFFQALRVNDLAGVIDPAARRCRTPSDCPTD